MAGRTLEPWQRRMWDMARIRLRDVRSAPWPATAKVPAAGTRPATIGDVYSSERAAAFLLRWHVYRPAHIVSGGEAGSELVKAFKLAKTPATDPTTWDDAEQAKLIQGLWDHSQAVGTDDLKTTLTHVRDWPRWAGREGHALQARPRDRRARRQRPLVRVSTPPACPRPRPTPDRWPTSSPPSR